MEIEIYWPQCNYINKKWVEDNDGIDSFWLECTFEEAHVNSSIHIPASGVRALLKE